MTARLLSRSILAYSDSIYWRLVTVAVCLFFVVLPSATAVSIGLEPTMAGIGTLVGVLLFSLPVTLLAGWRLAGSAGVEPTKPGTEQRRARQGAFVRTLAQAESEAREVLDAWSIGAAAIGWVPGSMFALTGADIRIVRDIANAFCVEQYSFEEVSAALGATVAGKVVAGEMLSLVPGFGWAVKAGVAAAVTKAMGETLISYFKERSPLE